MKDFNIHRTIPAGYSGATFIEALQKAIGAERFDGYKTVFNDTFLIVADDLTADEENTILSLAASFDFTQETPAENAFRQRQVDFSALIQGIPAMLSDIESVLAAGGLDETVRGCIMRQAVILRGLARMGDALP